VTAEKSSPGGKGVARFEIFVHGVPAHAGTRPEDGRSAIRELGNIIQTLEAMNDIKRGVTVNVGVVRGGTKPNVIAEEAYAKSICACHHRGCRRSRSQDPET